VELLRVAHERFTRLGALPHLKPCERALLACGSGPARRAVLRGAALTPQELAVATLVCSGRTNREVAAELVLSVKTIEFHLGNAYAKLGVTSRTQLCTALTSS
jgi:DNA-binding NarL/FixJ family response regulator